MMLGSNLNAAYFLSLVCKLPFLPGCTKDDLSLKFYTFTRVDFNCFLLFRRFKTLYLKKLASIISLINFSIPFYSTFCSLFFFFLIAQVVKSGWYEGKWKQTKTSDMYCLLIYQPTMVDFKLSMLLPKMELGVLANWYKTLCVHVLDLFCLTSI